MRKDSLDEGAPCVIRRHLGGRGLAVGAVLACGVKPVARFRTPPGRTDLDRPYFRLGRSGGRDVLVAFTPEDCHEGVRGLAPGVFEQNGVSVEQCAGQPVCRFAPSVWGVRVLVSP